MSSATVVLASIFGVAGNLSAQAVVPAAPAAPPTANPAETIELSPFVVTETGETGWVATETLGGTRLRTNFKDVPNQLETLTKEFMEDLAVTSLDEARPDAQPLRFHAAIRLRRI
jgi:outer membrane receptor for ferric coprogen and ferric-rhodotorulic acid